MEKFYKYLILFLCIFSSCVVEEDVDLSGNYQRKPVVFSVISPQNDNIKVYVSRTLSYGEEVIEKNLVIKGSSVILSSNEKSVSLPFDSLSGVYSINTSDFPIRKGEKYSLEVTLPTGEKATSETIVPSADIIIDSITDKRSGPFIEYEFDNAFIYRFEHKVLQGLLIQMKMNLIMHVFMPTKF